MLECIAFPWEHEVSELSRIREAVDFSGPAGNTVAPARASNRVHEAELMTRPPATSPTSELGERTNTFRELTHRVEAEYAEMPGLSLTLPQAQRLWVVDRQTCEKVFVALTARGVLRKTARGRFVRIDT